MSSQEKDSSTDGNRQRRRVGFITGVLLIGTVDALIHNSMPLRSRHDASTIAVRSSPSKLTLSVMMSTVKDEKKNEI